MVLVDPTSACRIGRVDPCRVPVILRHRVLLVCIGLDQAGVDGHSLAADQTFLDAARDGRFEQVSQQLTIAKPAMTVLGEGGMIRDPVAQIEAAEPAICQVQMHLFAQPPLRPDAEGIAHQQHSDQQLGTDGGTAGVVVEICKMGTDAAQVDEPVDGSKQVVLRDVILKRELVEQRWLSLLPWSHHRQFFRPLTELNQRDALRSSPSFSTEYAQSRHPKMIIAAASRSLEPAMRCVSTSIHQPLELALERFSLQVSVLKNGRARSD